MPVIQSHPLGQFTWPGLVSADAAATIEFYTGLFGWQAERMDLGDGEFTKFMLRGHIVCGMYEMAPERKAAGLTPRWNSYLSVRDVDTAVAQAESLGATVVQPPCDVNGDRMATILDPQGARVSLWQAIKPQEPAPVGEPGAPCWNELVTTDSSAAADFYSALAGWTYKPFEGGPMPYTVIMSGEAGIGGIIQKNEYMADMPVQWLPYFMVDDASAAAKRARELGGIAHGPMEIPGAGQVVMMHDPQGAAFCVIRPEPAQ